MRHSFIEATLLGGVLALSSCGPAPSRTEKQPEPQAGISQLVESRSGRTSCWGVVIRLSTLRFAKSIAPEQIEITESKHSSDLRAIMQWRVEDGGKRLVVDFRPECGDFGSGNSVIVHVMRSAILGYEGPYNRFEWLMGTDVE